MWKNQIDQGPVRLQKGINRALICLLLYILASNVYFRWGYILYKIPKFSKCVSAKSSMTLH